MNLHTIANKLNALPAEQAGSMQFDCYPIAGDVEVLQVNIIGREELPIFLSVTDNQILCITYLWGKDEVIADKQFEMMAAMLELNIPMPLSAFASIDNKYVLYGALSTHADIDQIAQELTVLSDNCLEVIDEMTDYLI
ncbi:YjfI family protein [Shewanella sp. NIFS-20-20]|uniref:YjfI family protein n=1 Tax=Shewanella sp. NIFS-20-20 TaxID=2853806 RepID=UPI001C43D985|nr:DUF2170 family protein [Shewanella sp. NIFS-20-20]MBV7314688.1 YjfI family protein [Shewanella sp. NIFS-20-20]